MCRYNVMLVDDDPMYLRHLRNMVNWSDCGFNVVCSSTSSKNALSQCAVLYPDLAILDICMPVYDGIELSKKMLALNPDLVIVLLTSFGELDTCRKALQLGVTSYLLKHEINAETLEKELASIAGMLREKRRKRVLMQKNEVSILLNTEDADRQRMLLGERCFDDRRFQFAALKVIVEGFALRRLNLLEQFGANLADPDWLELCDTEGLSSAVFVRRTTYSYACLLTFMPQPSLQAIHTMLHTVAVHIQRLVSERYGARCTVVIGRVFDRITELPGRFQVLDDLSEQLILIGYNRVIFEHELPRIQPGNPILDPMLEEQLRKSIASHDASKALSILYGTFERLRVSRNAEEIYAFSNMVVRVLRDFQRDIFSKEPLYADNLDDLVAILSDRVEMLCSRMQSRKYERYSYRVRSILRYIDEHCGESITLADLADRYGLSSEYLRHLCKKELGMTLNTYMTNVKIERAKVLLEEGYKISEVSEMTGFLSSQYFSTVFRKQVGMTPAAYAQSKRETTQGGQR